MGTIHYNSNENSPLLLDEYGDVSPANISVVEMETNPPERKNFCSGKIVGLAAVTVVVATILLGLVFGLSSTKQSKTVEAEKVCPPFVLKRTQKEYATTNWNKWLQQDCAISQGYQCPNGYSSPITILISLDGFRADYTDRNLTPVINKIRDCGVRAKSMRPSFPSKTFPNHYSIVTGLHPESHGIIDNTMYDMNIGNIFTLYTDEKNNKEWWLGEPIWNTVRKSGKKSATFFWPGSEADIQGTLPNYCYKFDNSIPYEDRVDQILAWVDLPQVDRPDFITLYLNQPDKAGHDYGPNSDQVNGNITVVDQVIGQLMDGLVDRKLDKCINVIIVSDHGMAEMNCGLTIDFTPEVDSSKLFFLDGILGRITSKYIIDYTTESVVEQTNGESPNSIKSRLECKTYDNKKQWYSRAYLKEDLPKRFHYAKSNRIEEVLLLPAESSRVAGEWTMNQEWCGQGDHGYDNAYKSMQASFSAYGPSFKENYEVEPFENIELYNLMTVVMNLDGAENNGTAGLLNHILRNPPALEEERAPLDNYITCPFPDTLLDTSTQDCSCTGIKAISNKTLEEIDKQLDLDESQLQASMNRHLPFGQPSLDLKDANVCQLAQINYITGYSHQYQMPLWSAYRLTMEFGSGVYDGIYRYDENIANCSRLDVRLHDFIKCSDYADESLNIVPAFLYPPGFSGNVEQSTDAYISSNLVPMYSSFKNGIWRDAMHLVEEYSVVHRSIQVIQGPLFDYDFDGLADDYAQLVSHRTKGGIPIPTHYYITMLKCSEDNEDLITCTSKKDIATIIIPHLPETGNCWGLQADGSFNYLKDNIARLKDVELLTGLKFLAGETFTNKVELQTFLPIGLWDRISWLNTMLNIQPEEPNCPTGFTQDHPPLVLVSIDGVRPDILDKADVPTLKKLMSDGVSTDYTLPPYPSLTFPSHYTIATGLYPDVHGIVANSMYDEEMEKDAYLGSPNYDDPAWWGGEPIWNTVVKQNKTSMTIFWPGADVAIQGMHPSIYYNYDGSTPYEVRTDRVLQALDGDFGEVPALITTYYSEVDHVGHSYGHNHSLVLDALHSVDKYIQSLMDGLYRRRFHNCVNVVIVSDHGMADLSCDRSVLLQDYLSYDERSRIYIWRGFDGRLATRYHQDGGISPLPEEDQVPIEKLLVSTDCKHEAMKAYDNNGLPVRFHYASNNRSDEIKLVMKDAWQVDNYSPWCQIKGQHGSDPTYTSMHSIFIAYGPSLKKGVNIVPFQNIELYNFFSDLIGLNPAPNNGTAGSLWQAMENPPELTFDWTTDYIDIDYPIGLEENITSTQCICSLDPVTLGEANERLYLDETSQSEVESLHLPYGVPGHVDYTMYKLHQKDYIMGYSPDLHTAVWSAYTLKKDENNLPVNNKVGIETCLRLDIRIDPENQTDCETFDNLKNDLIIPVQLFPSEFSNFYQDDLDTLITTNIQPMKEYFANGMWKYVNDLALSWASTNNEIYIIAGPVFDYDRNGIMDDMPSLKRKLEENGILIPTDYFITIMRLQNDWANWVNPVADAQSFILPHVEKPACLDNMEYLFDHRVRLRDIELITALTFFTGDPSYTNLLIRLRMHNVLWPVS